MGIDALRDSRREQRTIHLRLFAAFFLMTLLFLGLASRYYFLQIIEYEKYHTKSDSNRVFLQRVPPTRGLIVDRNHRLLAENQPSFMMTVVPDEVKSLETLYDYLKSLDLIDDADIAAFKKRRRRHRSFEQVPLRLNLSDREIAIITANRPRLRGVEVKADLVRHYPYGELVAHMLGYVGRINDREQRDLDEKNYAGTHHIGKIGVEKTYEKVLHGQVGFENVETNAQGRVLRVLKRVNPEKGKTLRLHLDIDLQKVAFDALNGSRGAIVALDTETGGVLAAVSTPGFDPNHFVNGISFADYDALKNDLDIPLFNRVLQAQYPPGSTIKPVMLIAGLEEKVITTKSTVQDPGWYKLPNDPRLFRDWKRQGHGVVDMYYSMEQSCDVFYYDLAYRLGIHNIHKYYGLFGLGEKTGIDVPSEWRGINPSPDWKRKQGRSSWYTGDSLNIGIGQGFLLATPMQLASLASIIANEGEKRVPTMVAAVNDKLVLQRRKPSVILDNEVHWKEIKDSMERVVHGRRGTARAIAKGLKYRIAGKTGTAQVVGIAQGAKYDAKALKERQRDHALFLGYAPADKPQIALAVMVENGGSGSSVAAPIARKVFDTWILRQKNRGSDDIR